ncbi:MAG TPA: hypothetical protein VEC01_14805 [Noviherbaspirillum sp.]|uniref:hypothetical protein n=1 Tax=Noviherbaspirillum sp. TaxID=1926288 RepID=UPI002D2511E0|nr:hypothetical protein [Noviherbaspirillum sp.]HYD96597.1 hypothetical protein [Noviherbaspirillum sp.]
MRQAQTCRTVARRPMLPGAMLYEAHYRGSPYFDEPPEPPLPPTPVPAAGEAVLPVEVPGSPEPVVVGMVEELLPELLGLLLLPLPDIPLPDMPLPDMPLPDELLGEVAEEPDAPEEPELPPIPDILPVPHAASTSAHARGMVHFNIKFSLKNAEQESKKAIHAKMACMRVCRIFQLTKVPAASRSVIPRGRRPMRAGDVFDC